MTGHAHPITLLIDDITKIFTDIGFDVVDGPELDSEWYNFDALNVPRNHPSRDMQDTFFIDKKTLGDKVRSEAEEAALQKYGSLGYVLRTHTSNMQIRTMEKWVKEGREFPLAIVCPGKVFRNEATDARHEAQFHQVEGLLVGKGITLAHLRGTLEHFFSTFYARPIEIRFRSSFFPFVEPGVEVDMQCFKCGGLGQITRWATELEKKNLSGDTSSVYTREKCNLCSGSGWIEIMGAGMVHPNVLENAGVNPKEYQGFAFGGGIDRIAMLRWGFDDIRMLYNGDLRVVNQF
jgi:phenylalanyl-tRNA synthetase alpha chain